MQQARLTVVLKKTSKSVCASTVVVSSDSVSYYINFFSYEDSGKRRRGL